MVKIVMVTDTHAGVRNDNPVFQRYQKTCFDWVFDYIDEHDIRTVIHLGDIFDRRKYVNFLTAKRLREDFFQPLEARGIDTHIVVGNHDLYYKDTHEVNALREVVAGRYHNIHIYSVPTVITVDDLPIQLLPWITQSNWDTSMEAIHNPKAQIAMGHLEISGFTMHRGLISDHGKDRIIFDKFDRVYSGHYHHRSTIGNITYIGSLGEYTWSDFNDPRGFSVFDTETRELEFIQNPHRMFRVVKYDDASGEDLITKIQNSNFSEYKDSYVKIVVVNKTNPYIFDLFFDALYKAEPLDIQIVEDMSVLVDSAEDAEVDEAESTDVILRKYIGGLTLPLDSVRMEKFMIGVYQEALEVEI